ncbi:MAG: metal-sensing transcriptional repressor [Lachnospiraceae bacterium]
MAQTEKHTRGYSHIEKNEHNHTSGQKHEHSRTSGQKHEHSHNTEQKHEHHHSDIERTKRVNRMARIIGHANKVKSMIAEDADCTDILIQMAAVRAALTSLSKLILEEHINECMTEMSEFESMEDRQDHIDGLMDVINQFVK